jgi:hypothetical protein
MKRIIHLVAVGVICASVIGCACKKGKRYNSAYYDDCCSACSFRGGVAGSINGVVPPGPVVSPQTLGAYTGPIGRNVNPASLDVRSTAALTPDTVRR